MNELYNKTIEKDGRTYRYDPDYDCWYRVFSQAEYDALSHGEKYGWIYISAACLIFAALMVLLGN